MRQKIFLLMLLLSLTVEAQTVQDNISTPFIEVNGTAEKLVVPDIIYVSVTLSEKSNGNKKYTIADQETALFSILQKLNIDQKDISLGDVNTEITTYKRRETGFEQKKAYNVKLSNAAQTSKLFEALFNANIKEADISRMEHSKIEEYRKEVRIAALQAAKAKAEYLLAAIGEQIGKPLEITENVNSRGYVSNLNGTLREPESIEGVAFETIVIVFSYHAKFGIK